MSLKGISMNARDERAFTFWITIQRAQDLPAQWIAHCLDVDVVTYGASPKEAFQMVEEAVSMVIVDDLSRDLEPTRRRASIEEWDILRRMLLNAESLPLSALETDEEGVFVIALPSRFVLQRAEIVTVPLGGAATVPAGPARDWSPRHEAPLEVQRVAKAA